MKRHLTEWLVVAFLTIVGGTWWMFRSVETKSGRMRVTKHYFLGRATEITIDFEGDGRIDERWLYSWREPAVHHQLPREVQADRNSDGRWDTWVVPENRSDLGTIARYSADLNDDGQPDWSFREPWASGEGLRKIAERRGF